eukprot:scaffold6588_cov123-Isochrysis_galbana.AAC.2
MVTTPRCPPTPLCKSSAIASASLPTPQKATAAELVRPLAAVEAWRQCRSQRSRSARQRQRRQRRRGRQLRRTRQAASDAQEHVTAATGGTATQDGDAVQTGAHSQAPSVRRSQPGTRMSFLPVPRCVHVRLQVHPLRKWSGRPRTSRWTTPRIPRARGRRRRWTQTTTKRTGTGVAAATSYSTRPRVRRRFALGGGAAG